MRQAVVAGVLVLVYALPGLAQKRPVTIDDVMAMKAVASPAVSPDGTQVLYTVRAWEAASAKDADRQDARTRIWRVPVTGGDARQLTYGERGDTQPQWSPDGRYISFVSARGAGEGDASPKGQIYLMRSDGGEALKLTDAKESVSAYAWSPDSKRIAYVTQDARSSDEEARRKKRDDARVYEGDLRYAHLWTIDVESREATRLTDGRTFTIGGGAPSWSADSTRLAFAAAPTAMIRDDRSDIYVLDVASKQVDKITTNSGPDTAPRWSPDGKTIAYLSEPNPNQPLGDGIGFQHITQAHLVLYDVASSKHTDVSRKDFDLTAGTPTWSADSARLYFTAGRRVYNEVFAYDVAKETYARLTPNRHVSLGSRSRDGSVIAFITESPTAPPDVHVADADFTSIRKLTTVNPQVADFALGETEVVTWKSSDGKEIEGVLLKPVGVAAGEKAPLLVVPHGGPTGAYTNGFRVGGLEGGQALAGQGWAVLYPNVRGSTNYGEAFMRANIPDWGGGDWRDLMAGVDAMIAKGVADPNRLALAGWSYGGYMTAWGITQTTRFKAAMVGAGITNVWSMYGTNDIPNYLGSFFGGNPDSASLALYMERSAMTHVDKVTTPTLILHGANDERVPTGQALELHRALKERGKTTELVFYPREGHGIQEYYHQKDRLTRIHAWLSRYVLGGGRKTTTQ